MLTLLCVVSDANSMTVQLSADRTRIGVGDAFSVTVSMSIDDGSTAPDPDLSLPRQFDLVATRSSTSTSISIVNGAVTQTRTVNVISTVRANEEGRFTLGPATVVSNGKAYRSRAIQVEVVQGGSRPRASSTPGQGSVTADQLEEIEQNLFISASADRESVYVGEQILLSYDLYSRYRIQNPKFGAVPSYTGFWAEPVFEASRLEQRPETVNGRSYNTSRLKQVALFPTVPGSQKIEQLEFICDIPVRSRRRSLFDPDDFFNWDPFRSRQVTVRSEDITFTVKSLPGGAPSSFGGGVGDFSISAQAVKSGVTQGDPLTVQVVVEGYGNIHGVSEPMKPSTDQFKFYDPKANVETSIDGARVGGKKTFEYVVIPTASGRIELPPFEMAYFSPGRTRYDVARTQPIALDVTPAQKVEQVAIAAPSGKAVQLVGEDIRFIKPDQAGLSDQAGYLHETPIFWALNGLPGLGLFAAWMWRRRQLKLEGDVAYARKRRSRGEAAKRLGNARELLSDEGAAFYSEIHRTLSSFLADRMNLEVSGLTSADVNSLLVGRGVDQAVIDQVVEIIQTCDQARYAPSAAQAADRQNLLDRTTGVIDTLEQAV